VEYADDLKEVRYGKSIYDHRRTVFDGSDALSVFL